MKPFRATLLAGLVLTAMSTAAHAGYTCQLPDVTDVEAKLDTIAVPKGMPPARQRVRYYDLANNGTLIVGEFLARDAARNPDLSEYEEHKVKGLNRKIHLGCGAVYTGGKGSCPILHVEYDVRSRRIIDASCIPVLARVFL